MNEVFELSFYGGGGFPYSEVWNMDIPKRKYNLSKVTQHYEKIQEKRDEKANVITEKTDIKKTIIPKFLQDTKDLPTYSSTVKK
jgi:hypothetical protein